MQKRKVAAPRQGTATLTLGLSPDLRDSLKRLSAARKATAKAAGQGKFIIGIVDEAITELAALLKNGKKVAFIPVPRSSDGRTALRVGVPAHAIAQKASEAADVPDAARYNFRPLVYASIRHAGPRIRKWRTGSPTRRDG